jgi:hypothetical protein
VQPMRAISERGVGLGSCIVPQPGCRHRAPSSLYPWDKRLRVSSTETEGISLAALCLMQTVASNGTRWMNWKGVGRKR